MTNAIGILRELHRLRRHIKNLQDEIKRVPLQLRAQQAKLGRQEDEIKAAHDALNHLKVTIRENEVSLKQKHQQIVKWEGQLQGASSKKEYDALQHEIAAEKAKCGELEDAILADMAKSEEATAHIPELEKALKAGKDELARFDKTSRERVATLSEELKRAQAQLKEVEATLPPDIRPQYERLVGSMGEDALSLAKNNTCSACYTALTQQQSNDLLAGRLVTCKSCGRIVYLAEEAL
jgi:predicted  nucleic acid-binding Zn-ribbon protein